MFLRLFILDIGSYILLVVFVLVSSGTTTLIVSFQNFIDIIYTNIYRSPSPLVKRICLPFKVTSPLIYFLDLPLYSRLFIFCISQIHYLNCRLTCIVFCSSHLCFKLFFIGLTLCFFILFSLMARLLSDVRTYKIYYIVYPLLSLFSHPVFF